MTSQSSYQRVYLGERWTRDEQLMYICHN